MDFALPGSFWDRFVEEHWECAPTVLEQPFPSQLIDETALFRALVEASRAWAAGESVGLSFHIEHGLQQAAVGPKLPREADGDLAGYARRVSSAIDGRDFMLGMAPLQRFDRRVWFAAISFLEGLYERVGLPAKRAELEVFFGRYRTTPLGVHRDTASNFMYVVGGTKRIAVWPAAYFDGVFETKRPMWIHETIDTVAVEEHLPHACILEGSPGDVLYWPSSHWHVALSDALAPSAAVAIALLLNAPDAAISGRIAGLDGERTLRGFDFSKQVPEAMHHVASQMRDVDAAKYWARFYSGYGFDEVPPLDPNARLSGTSGRIAPTARLVHQRCGAEVEIAVHGHVGRFEASMDLSRWLDELVTGRDVPLTHDHVVRWLVSASALQTADPQHIDRIIERIAARLDPDSRYVPELRALLAGANTIEDIDARLVAGCRGRTHSLNAFVDMSLEEKILTNLITPETAWFRFDDAEADALASVRGRILVVPCSRGEEVYSVATLAPHAAVVGVDVQPALIRFARTRDDLPERVATALASRSAPIEFVAGDAFELDEALHSFDWINCRNFLGYFVEDVAVACALDLFARTNTLLLDSFCLEKFESLEPALTAAGGRRRDTISAFDRGAGKQS